MKKLFEDTWFVIIMLLLPILIIGVLIVFNVYNDNKYEKENYHLHEIETVKVIETKKPNTRKITKDERELLARLVSCEASICSTECKRDVVSVVFNRLDSGKWGDTIEDVVFYPNAFTPATSGKIYSEVPNKDCYSAVDYVLKNGTTLPTEVRYFRTDYDFNWENYQNYKILDNVYFGYFTNWKNGEW